MPDPAPEARPLTVLRARGLDGRFRVPGDPGLFCLAAMLGAVARGETVIYTGTDEPDANLAATRALLAAAGTPVELADDRWHIGGLGALGLLEPEGPLDFTGADRALPLALGLLAPYPFETCFAGAATASSPMIEALRATGAEVGATRSGRLPISIRGPRGGIPLALRLPDTEAARAALLLAALGLPGTSSLVGAPRAADGAERLVRHFGGRIEAERTADGRRNLEIAGLPLLGARTLSLAGDPELAVFAIVAGLIVPHSDVLIENVLLDAAQNAVLSVLLEMGGDIEIVERRLTGSEEIADLRVRHSALLGTALPSAGLAPAAVLALAVAGAFAAGETRIPRPAFAEHGQPLQGLADGLQRNGVRVSTGKQGLGIGRPEAGSRLGGDTVATGGDALLALAFRVYGMATAAQVALDDDTALEAAYPGLLRCFEAVGAEFYRRWAA